MLYIASELYVWLAELLAMMMRGIQLTLLNNQKDHKLTGWLLREVMLLHLVAISTKQNEEFSPVLSCGVFL